MISFFRFFPYCNRLTGFVNGKDSEILIKNIWFYIFIESFYNR